MSFINTPSIDKKKMTYEEDVDITIAAGSHPFATDGMYLFSEVYGNTAMRVTPNILQHGLSPVQVGISTTKHGICRWFVPENGKLVEIEIPQESDVRMVLARQILGDEEASEELLARAGNLIPHTIMNKQLFQRKTGRVLSASLPDIGDEVLLELDPEEIEVLLESLVAGGFEERAGEAIVRLGIPATTDMLQGALNKVLSRDVSYDVPEMSEELPGWNMEMSRELKTKVVQQFAVRALDLRGPPPVELANWGIPMSVFSAWKAGRKMYEGFLNVLRTEGTPMTCALLADMIQEEFGIDRPKLRQKGEAEATYKVVEKLITDQHRAQDQAYMKWVNGGDPISRSLNLGDHVQALGEWTGDMDARPRPTMSDEPLSEEALGDFEVASLKQDLNRMSTPRDTMVPLANLNPFWAESCWERNEDGTFSGHPGGFWLDSFIGSLLQEHDELYHHDVGDEDEWDQDTVNVKNDLQSFLFSPHQKTSTYQDEETGEIIETFDLKVDEGVQIWRILSRNGNSVMASLVKENRVPFSALELDENHPAVQAGGYRAGAIVEFWSRAGETAFRACWSRVPTLSVSESGQPFVSWTTLGDMYPMVREFMTWAVQQYDGGAEGADEEVREWLMKISTELSQVQRRQMQLLVAMNAEANASDFLRLIKEANELVAENPSIVTSKDFEGREGRTSLWGLLNESLIDTMKDFRPDTALLPEPRRVIGTDLITGDNVWGTNWNLVFRAMGYSIDPQSYQPGRDGLVRMVSEGLNRTNPANPDGLRVLFGTAEDGSTMRKFQKRSLTPWTELGEFSNGLLGDMLAQWWANSVGYLLPSGLNLSRLYWNEIQAATGCSRKDAQRLVVSLQCCARIPSLRRLTVGSVVEKLLPLPVVGSKGYVDALIDRMCLMSRNPVATMGYINLAMAAIEPIEIASARASILQGASQMGSETVKKVLSILG